MSEERRGLLAEGPIVGQLDPLKALTPARVGLGRAGASMPLAEVLGFCLARARARDAVHEPFRASEVAKGLAALGLEAVLVESAARNRTEYLRRPDLGRKLSPESRENIRPHPADVALIVADGLSATAAHRNAIPLVAALLPLLERQRRTLAPVLVASQSRVALGDEAAAALGARLVIMLIGERPGLSSPDSLGAYLTFAPRPGITDAERNCVSNIRNGGLAPPEAASKVAWLVEEALRLGMTGVALKDGSIPSGAEVEGRAPTPPASLA